MRRVMTLTAAVAIGLAGCSTPALEIRELGGAHADRSDGTTSGRVALGMTQLAMGNVGLALETFRRAVREDPQSHKALQGLAECYLQLGKPSLARRSLEQALALRPDVPELYRALAAAAQGEGKPAEAAALRREAAARSSSALPQPLPAAPQSAPVAASAAPQPALKAVIAPQQVVQDVAVANRSDPQTVTIDLALATSRDKGPRLVRLSLGEVALMTKPGSPFAVARREADSTVHAPLRILNAARIQGIAARTRSLLASKGLRGANIGDAPARMQYSELRYQKGEAGRARTLAAKLPFKVMLVERDGALTLLLGRNAAP